MKTKNRLRFLTAAIMAVAATTAPGSSWATEPFWLGGDISGTTTDEARGHYTMNTEGVKTETTRLMKDYGMNATRLRVWVNPKDGFSSPEDVLEISTTPTGGRIRVNRILPPHGSG